MPLLNIKGTYEVKAMCNNCRGIDTVKIPKGRTIKDYLKDYAKCPTCGCKTLEQASKVRQPNNQQNNQQNNFSFKKWKRDKDGFYVHQQREQM